MGTYLFLLQELIHGDPLPIDEMDASDSEEEGEEWMPDPVDADPCKRKIV